MLNPAIFTLERSDVKIGNSPVLQEIGQVILKLFRGSLISFFEMNNNLDRCKL